MKISGKGIFKVSAVVIIIGLLAYPKFKKDEKKDTSPKGAASTSKIGPPIKVSVLPIGKDTLDFTINAIGTIQANEEVELRSEIAGKIVRVNFKEGTKVSKGQLLVKLFDEDLQAELRKAYSQLKLVSDNEGRQKTLLEKGGISIAEMENSSNRTDILRADISILKARISKTEIRAPFEGVIGLENVSIGSYISPANVIATMQDLSKVKIVFSLPEKYSQGLMNSGSISFSVQGLNDTFTGQIYAIDPKIDQATRTLQVKATAANFKSKLRPGAFADITLGLDKNLEAIMIPTEAIIPDIRGHKIFLYRSGIAEPSPIKLGVRREKFVQVIDGLSIGDTIITSGIIQLKPGAPVKIKKAVS
ncbi:MAG TPA: efflux RND transporter periplasmic adaptor subunit [Cytophagaceae bacterium]|jgi:membrane fusion protein (multidrug efflux system)